LAELAREMGVKVSFEVDRVGYGSDTKIRGDDGMVD
jgi:hypothetical protein